MLFSLLSKKLRMLLHPLFLFVVAQISWALLMAVWITWYLKRSQEFEQIINKLGISQPVERGQIFILIQGCVLMGILLIALYAVFVNFRREARLNRLQDSILSSVTHELKTPVASIRMYVETMLLRELSAEERSRFLGRTLNELDRLQSLVDRILLSAQLRTESSAIRHRPLDILPIISASWRRVCERSGDSRTLQLEGIDPQSPDGETCMVKGNEYELGILFDNLLDNAVKYTRTGGRIVLKILPQKDKIDIQVIDDGIGIENAQISRIFHRFYRVESASRRHVKGSGLGLSVAQAIVKAHHGSISASSKGPEKGTTFHVSFKRSVAHH